MWRVKVPLTVRQTPGARQTWTRNRLHWIRVDGLDDDTSKLSRYGGISSNGEDWATEGTGNEVFGSERKLQLKEKADKAAEEIKLSQKEISSLTEMLKKVKLQSDEKDKRVETAEAHVAALQKQAADSLLEYDRLSSESSSWFSELRK
ncbi:hypothetical protein T459_23470 [Capsicum annuum]|uniref:Uncharacterized protein n=1 Tax=Capsicum annuum TaxID=4072 RepID=A0A2G2YSQ0_CAPAN|nr:hypothetical protein T459_23470 [Capsicum annuum]